MKKQSKRNIVSYTDRVEKSQAKREAIKRKQTRRGKYEYSLVVLHNQDWFVEIIDFNNNISFMGTPDIRCPFFFFKKDLNFHILFDKNVYCSVARIKN